MDTTGAAETFTRMLHALDVKDWDGVRRTFAPQLDMDYTSLFGGAPVRISRDEQVAAWRAFASVFTAIQHVTGPILVTPQPPDSATAATHVRGYHHVKDAPGGDMWMVAGHYDVRLTRIDGEWKIAAITLRVFYQEGNLRLPEIARARAASPSSKPDN